MSNITWRIILDKPFYRLGEWFDADVLLDVKEATPFTCLKLSYRAEGNFWASSYHSKIMSDSVSEFVEHQRNVLTEGRNPGFIPDISTWVYDKDDLVLMRPQASNADSLVAPGQYKFHYRRKLVGEWHSATQEDLCYGGHPVSISYMLVAHFEFPPPSGPTLFDRHPGVRFGECLKVLPVFNPAFHAQHQQPVSVHKDASTSLLPFGSKVHVTAALEHEGVICDEPFTLDLRVSNDSSLAIRSVRVQLYDILIRHCISSLRRDPLPVAPEQCFQMQIAPHSSFSQRLTLCYPPFQTDSQGKQIGRSVVSILGHVIEKRHQLRVMLDFKEESHHPVELFVPLLICPPTSAVPPPPDPREEAEKAAAKEKARADAEEAEARAKQAALDQMRELQEDAARNAKKAAEFRKAAAAKAEAEREAELEAKVRADAAAFNDAFYAEVTAARNANKAAHGGTSGDVKK